MAEEWGDVLFPRAYAAVLVISSAAAQRESIGSACRMRRCNVSVAGGWRDACFVLSRCAVDVIICDDLLADGSWKDVLSTIAPMPEAPRLVVLADGAPANVCAEVINLGGFDVLSKPLGEGDLDRAVAASCRNIRDDQEARAKRKGVMAAAAARTAAA